MYTRELLCISYKDQIMPSYVSTDLLKNNAYVVIYRTLLFLAVQYLVPMLLLVGLNAQVVWALRRSGGVYSKTVVLRRHAASVTSSSRASLSSPATTAKLSISSARQQQQQAPADGIVKMQKATRNVTIMVVIVVLMCIICHVVAMTAQASTTRHCFAF